MEPHPREGEDEATDRAGQQPEPVLPRTREIAGVVAPVDRARLLGEDPRLEHRRGPDVVEAQAELERAARGPDQERQWPEHREQQERDGDHAGDRVRRDPHPAAEPDHQGHQHQPAQRDAPALPEEVPDGSGHVPLGEARRRQRLGQLLAAAEPLRRLLFQAAGHRSSQRRRQVGPHAQQVGGRLVEVLAHHRDRARRVEDGPPGEREEHGHAERVEVAPGVHRVTRGLLRAHVVRRSDQLARRGEAIGIGRERHAEIRDHRPPGGLLDQDVVRLDVPVDDAVGVRVAQPPRDLLEQPGRLRRRQRAGALDPLGQRLTPDVGHDEEDQVVVLFDRVNRDDVGVGEPRREPGLAQEAVLEAGLRGEVRREQFERDRPVEAHVTREKHDAQPAPAQLALQGVLPGDRGLQLDEFAGVAVTSHAESYSPDLPPPTSRSGCCPRSSRSPRSSAREPPGAPGRTSPPSGPARG